MLPSSFAPNLVGLLGWRNDPEEQLVGITTLTALRSGWLALEFVEDIFMEQLTN